MTSTDEVAVFVDDGEDDWPPESDGDVALDILGELHIVTSYYADAGVHAGHVRIRLEGYLTPKEATALREIMTEARHRGTSR